MVGRKIVSKVIADHNLEAIARWRRIATACSMAIVGLSSLPTHASILADLEIPEEILRTEIITEARSPIDGQPLSAAEFAELVVQIQARNEREAAETIADNPKFKELFFLIRLRSFLRSVGIPIK
jgi:hypothetical protein